MFAVSIAHDGSMVLVYMLTNMGYIDGIHVIIYSSTMDPMGRRMMINGQQQFLGVSMGWVSYFQTNPCFG
jgi:hypothetical protein